MNAKTVRQDAWTEDDDTQLAELTLRHIREGSTQLAAFEEAAAKLGRTAAACGYRWNACVRKQYAAAVDIAKTERKEHKQHAEVTPTDRAPSSRATIGLPSSGAELTWNAILRFLRQYKNESQLSANKLRQLERDNELYLAELQDLRKENERLAADLRRVTAEHEQISQDYRQLVAIMERARQLTVLEPGAPPERPRFRVDQNGEVEPAK